MTRFSGRFGIALIVIFALTLAPILYARMTVERDECSSDAALLAHEAIAPGIELIERGPRATSIENRRLTGFVKRGENRGRMAFTIVRTFGLPPGLLQPAAALPGRLEPDVVERAVVSVDDVEIPVSYATEKVTGAVRTTAYFMTYRGEPITSPSRTRLQSAPAALVASRWPITLFVVAARAHPTRVERSRQALAEWVRAAWTHYHAVCPKPPEAL